MRALRGMPGLVLAVAVGTALAGWWALPVVTGAWIWISPAGGSPVRRAMIGAALGWGLLLGWTALHGPIGPLARRVGGLIWLPGWGLVLVTLAFPAVVAGLVGVVIGRGNRRG
ncbi:MAG: hypothetical protein ACJ8DC_17495 [Gemmatimonadales bacterium]